jgi:hypothetical protein
MMKGMENYGKQMTTPWLEVLSQKVQKKAVKPRAVTCSFGTLSPSY